MARASDQGAGVADQRADHIRPGATLRSRGRWRRRRAWRLSERARSQTDEHSDDLGELSVSERNFFNKFKLAYQRLTKF